MVPWWLIPLSILAGIVTTVLGFVIGLLLLDKLLSDRPPPVIDKPKGSD